MEDRGSELIWGRLTNDPAPVMNCYEDVLLDGLTIVKDLHRYRRRKILYSEALWTIWVMRCEWSLDSQHTPFSALHLT